MQLVVRARPAQLVGAPRPVASRRACAATATVLTVVAALVAAGCASSRAGSARGAAPRFQFRALPCTELPVASDTVDDTLYMTVDAPVHARPLPTGYTRRVLDALRSVVELPHPVVFPVYTGHASSGVYPTAGAGDSDRLRPAIVAEVEFTIGDTGRITGRVSTSSLSADFDRRLADAPRRADSLQLFPSSPDPRGPAGAVRLYVTVQSTRPPGNQWVPLLRVRVPQWGDAKRAAAVTTATAGASAETQTASGVRMDSVVVQIVIDETGHPVLSTFRLVEAHYREFARAVAQRLQQTTYRPASIGGCAVKGITELRYGFMVAR
jgi:hypothetical protein